MLENVARAKAPGRHRPLRWQTAAQLVDSSLQWGGSGAVGRPARSSAPRFDPAAYEVRRFSEETTLLIARGGDAVLVIAPAEVLISILARCDGLSSIGQIAASSAGPTDALSLLFSLVDAGCLSMVDVEVSA